MNERTSASVGWAEEAVNFDLLLGHYYDVEQGNVKLDVQDICALPNHLLRHPTHNPL